MNGMISLAVFMLVVASSVDGQISTEFLGTNGLFVAIIIGLIVVEVSRLVEVRNWKISMPDTVPPAVTAFVNSMLPLFLNIILIYGLNVLIIALTGSTFHNSSCCC